MSRPVVVKTALAVVALVSGALFLVGGLRGNAPALAATPAAVPALGNYYSVANDLTDGKSVALTTKLGQCTTSTGAAGPSVVGGLRINAFQIVSGLGILFSDTHQTLDSQNHLVTEFVRYRLTPAGAMTLTNTTVSAAGEVLSTVALNCRIGKGAYFHSSDW
jgi:hypothetical protein